MAPIASDIERELNTLEAELKRLEAEYTMFFAGRLAKPPWETRSRVEAMVRRLDRMHINNTGVRFRFGTLQSRFAKFVELWNRSMRAKEEGRVTGSPLPRPQASASMPVERPERPEPASSRVINSTTFKDPTSEMDKVRELYDSLSSARREVGDETISFPKFVDLIKTQVGTIAPEGGSDVTFRVSVKEGKVAFTARAEKPPSDEKE